jgi:hypothetical protein
LAENELHNNYRYTDNVFNYTYFVKDYMHAGWFDTLVVDDDVSVGVFRPLKTFEQLFEELDDYYFDDLIIRVYYH